ncbi:MFS transporter [Candidatus Dojkabacteria bacterium]|nr:MFS transporter [Candidatus Dojkabacteria bacterium]
MRNWAEANIVKISIASVLASSMFFLPIVGLYLESRGIDYEMTFKLVSLYSFAIVVFEYPTGVIGDYFSHKISVFIGYLVIGAAFLMLALPGSLLYYAVSLVVLALGMSLVTGSITALLFKNSNNFRRDSSNVRAIGLIWGVIAGMIGTYLADFDLAWPAFVSSFVFFVAAIMIFLVRETPEDDDYDEGNLFSKAREGLQFVRKVENQAIRKLLLLGFVLGSFFISMKWLYSPVLDVLDISVRSWGLIISAFSLSKALGTWLYGKFGDIGFGWLILFFGIMLAGVVQFNFPLVSVIMFTGAHLIRGYIQTQSDFHIARLAPGENKASIISLKSFLVRLGAAVYLAANGFLLDSFSLSFVVFVSAVFFTVASLIVVANANLKAESC